MNTLPNLAVQGLGISWDNSYARLPERFYARLNPTRVAAPALVRLNAPLAVQLGLDPAALATTDAVAMFAGNHLPNGAEPVALAYAGHQFGNFVPQLGDGRAILLGEIVAPDGARQDIQLKGSGRTPFSRGGDGRAALGPVLREYLISEAMAAFAIPTTRALAAALTGETVLRETVLPGAVLTRVAASHIRVGTFQYFAARGDTDAVRLLADHVIARHYPDIGAGQYAALLTVIVTRQADLIASWMLVGFIHGVMNTDNTSIAGETIDYGPCAFMDSYDPGTVFSSIDRAGRYAYANQPRIGMWNLARLAECLLPLLSDDEASAKDSAMQALSAFSPRFNASFVDGLRRKLGLLTAQEDDAALIQDLLDLMAEHKADFTNTFRALNKAIDGTPETTLGFASAWLPRWQQRLADEATTKADRQAAMRTANPAYIPRNHLVEAALTAAMEHQDYAPFEALLDVITHPYDERPGWEPFAAPPREEERVLQTFCGT